MEIQQNVFKKRLWKVSKIIIWTGVFIFLYETVHLINDETFVPNWWIGMCFCLVFLTLYLVPTNKLTFRTLRWLFLTLFSFFLGWFLADLEEFIETVRILMGMQL